jgi:hypothetical protein
MTAPVAIGGVGGSGTRVVAGILSLLGFHLGGDLNPALDNLWFTLLFKRLEIRSLADDHFGALVRIFSTAMTTRARLTGPEEDLVRIAAAFGRPQHPAEWLRERAGSLLAACSGTTAAPRAWGWKEPNTHVVLDRLGRSLPGLRYVHVVRHGLDMAYSANQNQLRFWGEPPAGGGATPRASLKYWCAAHRAVAAVGAGMGSRFLGLNFDSLCTDPEPELRRLFDFLGQEWQADVLAAVRAALVRPPSIGRFRAFDRGEVDAADVDYVRSLGFDTSPW